MAKILDGRIVRDKIAQRLQAEISRRSLSRAKSRDSKCKLVIIQIGDLPASNTYIRQKVLFGQKIGALVDHQRFPENISQEKLVSEIRNLNSDSSVHGIIVQMPIPKHLDKDRIVDTVSPAKDVDGQTSTNIKLLFEGKLGRLGRLGKLGKFEGFSPATTKGVLTLLDYYRIPIPTKHVVIVGRSTLVGKPTALAFLNRNATVTICHSRTNHLSLITRHADILVIAAGKPKLITKDYVSKGQVVVDVGINILEKSRGSTPAGVKPQLSKPEVEPSGRKLIGDVDFDSVGNIVTAISPVPGGCGPMTVASLFENLLEAYQRQTSKSSVI